MLQLVRQLLLCSCICLFAVHQAMAGNHIDPNLTGGGDLSCSLNTGAANINELYKKTGNQFFDYTEIKILQNSTEISGWKLCYARNNTEECVLLGEGDGVWDASVNPGRTDDDNGVGGTVFHKDTWITYGDLSPNDQDGEVVLLDSDGKLIDYLAYTNQSDGCASQTYWDDLDGCGVCFDGKDPSEKDLARIGPDGTGDWGNNGDSPTPQTDNSDAYLSAEWRFDSCDLMADGEVPDASGNGLTAFVVGDGVETSLGKICNAGLVGHTKNDYLSVADNDLLDDTDALTVMAWINPTDLKEGGIFSKRELTGSDELDEEAYAAYFIKTQGNDTKLVAELALAAGESAYEVTAVDEGGVVDSAERTSLNRNFIELPWSWGTDQWVHIGLVFDGSLDQSERGKLYLFHNGTTTTASFAVDQTTIPNVASDLLLGAVPVAQGNSGNYSTVVLQGMIDEVNVVQRALSSSQIEAYRGATRTCAFCDSVVDHYAISYDSTLGITCQSTTATATAHDGADAVIIPGAGLELTFSGSADCSFSPATVVFDGVQSAVSSQMSCTSTGPQSAAVLDSDGVSERADEDPELEFVEAKFEFYDSTNDSSVIDAQISGKDSSVIPNPADIELRAIYSDPLTGACLPRVADQVVAVAMAPICIDPLSCVAGEQLVVAGMPTPANVSLQFDGNGRASIPFSYTDAGLIGISATAELPADDTVDPPLPAVTLSGLSNEFVVAPAGLCVTTVDPNADCSAANSSCSVFKHAGESFNLSVSAVGWEASGESHDDFCSGNRITPNYQQSGIELSSTLIEPSGGSGAVLAPESLDVLSGGIGTNADQSISEVGVFSITATPPDDLFIGQPSYMGEPLAASTSAYIGRFTPAWFEVALNTPLLADQCTGFSYMDADIAFGTAPQVTVTALNANGDTTLNYGGEFWRLESVLGHRSYLDSASTASASLTATLESKVPADWDGRTSFDGQAVMALSADEVRYGRVDLQQPFDAAMELQLSADDMSDADGICYRVDSDGDGDIFDEVCQELASAPFGGTELRYGRLQVLNAFGPETESLPVPLVVQYYNGSGFVTNTSDNCSRYINSSATLDYASYPDNPGGFSTTVLSPLLNTGFIDGVADPGAPLLLDAPSSAEPSKQGQLDLEFNAELWLQFGWGGAASVANPSGQVTFGRYRGHDKVIFWQENFSR